MKAGWIKTTLGEIAQIKGGKRVPKGCSLSVTPTPFPYLRVTDFLDDGSIDLSDLRYVDANIRSQIKNYIITSKDLYISIAGTIGKTGIISEELNGSNLTENACRLVFNSGINNKFIYYFTKTTDFIEQAGLQTRTAAQPKLALSRLSNIQLNVPFLNEQQRIVTILDEAFAGIATATANAEKNLANSRELFKSYLQSVFTSKGDAWEEKALGEVIEIRNGRNQQAVLCENGQYKIMGSAGNVMGYASDYICEAGTTIIGRKGNISKPIYINEPFWNVDTAFGFYPKDNLDKKFVYYLCLTIDFAKMNRGTTIPSLVKSELQTIQISFPKLLEAQQTIVQKLDALSAETTKLESIYQKKLIALNELKKSILNQAFIGNI